MLPFSAMIHKNFNELTWSDPDLNLEESNTTAKTIGFKATPGNSSAQPSWKLSISYRTSGNRCSGCDAQVSFTSNPGATVNRIIASEGGKIVVKASIQDSSGQPIDAQPVTITLAGKAIDDPIITTQLKSLYTDGATPNLYTGIAMKESSYMQFAPRTLFGKGDKWPNESFDGGSHIGLMMMPVGMEVAFNWLTNTEQANALFREKLSIVRVHVSQDRDKHPDLPELSAIQLEDNALGYYRLGNTRSNGYWIPSEDYKSWIENQSNSVVHDYVRFVRGHLVQ